ncbi:MAG: cell division protein FtsQ/DivIB [Gammaproteobacteria bacterium]|nr:cell division protein FtsQ/DivIB [Gammaproteobacteria bacterium]MDH5728802.1 cell division protein FtsQ/DivIB [Gammaproteobacteria bacterium]
MNRTSATPKPLLAKLKRLTIVVLLGVSVAVVYAGLTALGKQQLFSIEKVVVEGELSMLQHDQLIQAASENLNGNFFTFDVDRMYSQVKALQWVEQVWVDRVWPDTIRLRVKEQQPVAYWGEKFLINHAGVVFERGGFNKTLPAFNGPWGTQQDMLKMYSRLETQFSNAGLVIQSLEMDERFAWRAMLDNGVELVLGRATIEERVVRFVTAYEQNLLEKKDQLKRVDLRYGHGFAVLHQSQKKSAALNNQQQPKVL